MKPQKTVASADTCLGVSRAGTLQVRGTLCTDMCVLPCWRVAAQELCLPYVLVCAVDNSANGLSLHPGGPVQEYLDHKGAIAEVSPANRV